MTVSPRDQYLCGKKFVELAHRRLDASCVPVVAAGGRPARAESHADVRQARYYQELFDVLRTAILDELTHHRATLAAHEASEDVSGVRRMQRVVRVTETELGSVDRLIAALSARFPTSRITT